MKKIFFAVLFSVCSVVMAENYLINGGQTSGIKYTLVQEFDPAPGTKKVSLSFVIPQNFSSPTYNQQISDLKFVFTPEPEKRETKTDDKGNKILTAVWIKPVNPISVSTSFYAATETKLNKIESTAGFPVTANQNIPQDYLNPTDLVQSDSEEIRGKSNELTKGVKSQFDAVQRILAWIVDNMHLRWNGVEGHFYDEWGNLIAFDPSVRFPGPGALLINRDVFLKFLNDNDYDLLWTILGEKNIIGGRLSPEDWKGRLELSGAYRIHHGNVGSSKCKKFPNGIKVYLVHIFIFCMHI